MNGGGPSKGAAGLLASTLLLAVVTPCLAAAAGSPRVVTVAGSGAPGSSGIGERAVSARLDQPSGIAVDGSGDLFIADTDNCRVEEVPAASGTHYGLSMTAHHIYTVAGGSCSGARVGVGFPTGVAVDGAGDLFIADATDDRVLELPAAPRSRLHTVVGSGSPGSSGDGGPSAAARLDDPTGLAVDEAGDLFIADTDNCRVEEVPAASGTHYGLAMTAHHIYTVAGTGRCGSTGLGGPATEAELWVPTALAVDAAGDLFIADRGDGTVVELPVAAGTYYGETIGAGDLAVVAGLGIYASYLNDGFSATGYAAEVNFPNGLAVDRDGDLFIADTAERVVRLVPSVDGTVFGRPVDAGDLYTVIGALPTGTGDDSTRWVTAQVTSPCGLAVDAAGDLFFSDRGADEVRQIQP